MSIFAVALMFAVATPDPETADKAEVVKTAAEEGKSQEGAVEEGKEKVVCRRVRHNVGSRVGSTQRVCESAAQTKAEKKGRPRDSGSPSSEAGN